MNPLRGQQSLPFRDRSAPRTEFAVLCPVCDQPAQREEHDDIL
jgi:hypothetical protein